MNEGLSSSQRQSLLLDYDKLSRERNGINPKLSSYAKLTEKMTAIKARLAEYEDPEKYATALRKRRNKSRRKAVLRNTAIQKIKAKMNTL